MSRVLAAKSDIFSVYLRFIEIKSRHSNSKLTDFGLFPNHFRTNFEPFFRFVFIIYFFVHFVNAFFRKKVVILPIFHNFVQKAASQPYQIVRIKYRDTSKSFFRCKKNRHFSLFSAFEIDKAKPNPSNSAEKRQKSSLLQQNFVIKSKKAAVQNPRRKV